MPKKRKLTKEERRAENKRKYALKTERRKNAKHMFRFSLAFHDEKDWPVVCKLKSVGNKTDYIRRLIMADIDERGL